ncbi:hypothetical protein [Amycolatopsis sp. lyj-112]|uniref:hypothetical protein n=1 Tax=Amycolatopsis sp. lyj-112 TaxID=2789288 RepID=UPI003978D1B5
MSKVLLILHVLAAVIAVGPEGVRRTGFRSFRAGVLAMLVLPGQNAILAVLDSESPSEPVTSGRVAMYTGVFNLLWVVVTVLMIVRPGSTTGA